MTNKTCGECKWFSEKGNCCNLHNNRYLWGNDKACKDFDPIPKPTNGDRIIAGGMSALVEYRQKFIGHVCADRFSKKCNGATCSDGLLEWLNSENEVIYEE